MNKVVFFDVDGTLLNENRELPKSVKPAINELQKSGVTCVIATGRPPFGIVDYLDELNIKSFVAMNGQYVVLNGEVIYANPIQQDSLERLIDAAAEHKHRISFASADGLYGNAPNWYKLMESKSIFVKLGRHLISENIQKKAADFITKHRKYQKIEKSEYEGKTIYQCVLHAPEKYDAYYQELCPEYHFVRWGKASVDVCPENGSKAVGIEAMLNALHMDVSDSYAFGDGLNDIEMLEYVGTGIAMGNGREELKAVADVVTAAANEDGILKGLIQVGLLNK